MIKLILLNLYGTILPSNEEPILRQGVSEFMDKHKDKEFLISARKYRKDAIKDLELTDFVGYGLHTLEGMHKYVDYDCAPEKLAHWQKLEYCAEVVCEGRTPESFIARPYVEWIARERKIKLNDMLLVSHHPEDVELANTYFPRYGRIKVIYVPEFMDKSDTFSFEKVDVDSFQNKIRFGLQLFRGLPYVIDLR